jgi:hypothetical protein
LFRNSDIIKIENLEANPYRKIKRYPFDSAKTKPLKTNIPLQIRLKMTTMTSRTMIISGSRAA